ncbi:right-handed parallel beta-helix repeat-containing protein [Novipirellula artificiosorum]|nr:right-handed parallel beta-helix repeat-containing protein [Novipirellula artificiosorum]
MFAPSGSGTQHAAIKIAAYGEGDRPGIDAGGEHPAGLLLQNVAYWEVNGLEITNTDGTDEDQGNLFGIRVLVKGVEGIYHHIYIDDCFIHDVNGLVAGKKRGGIHVHVEDCEATKFHDLRLTNNRIVRVGGVGIGNSSSCGRVEFQADRTISHHLWTKVYVAGNFIDSTGRNNVIARVSKDAVYEHNTLANSSRCDTGHSIFCFNTDGIKIQYNEAYGNLGEEGQDRGGYDADYNCVNTFIQYNYSHDNMWFCGIMKRRNRNVVIRYNISQNDKKGIYFYGFERNREAENVHIYNNTHFIRKGLDVCVFPEDRTPLNSVFENNLFYFEDQGAWGKNAEGINTSFRNNLYFNLPVPSADPNPIVADPLFRQPGLAGTNINLKSMASLRGYRLRLASPCIDAGVPIMANGGKDLLGTPLQGDKTAIGALEPIR